MAEYFDNPLDSAAPEERKRRLLSLYEMTGNPFLQGSPYSAQLRQAGTPQEQERPRFAPPQQQQPSYEPLVDVPPGTAQQATSAALRGTPTAPAVAADTSLTSIPTQGPQNSRGSRTPQAGYSEQPQAASGPAADPRRAKVHEAIAELEKQMANPDMTKAVEGYRQRYASAGPDMVLGMAMSDMGGAHGREFGGQVLKNALAMRQPQTTDYGTIDQSGFTADPMKEREFRIQRGEKKIALLETIAKDSENAEDRRAAREALALAKREAAAAAGDRRKQSNDFALAREEDRLAKMYDAQTKDYRAELNATTKVAQLAPTLLGRRPNAIEQDTLAILLNKFLDPTSVVREGEFDRVAKAQGYVDRAANIMNRIAHGERMSDRLISQIVDMSTFYEKASRAKLQYIGDETSRKARGRGLDPTNIIIDPYYRHSAESGSAPGRGGSATDPIRIDRRVRAGAPGAAQPSAGATPVDF